MVLFQITCTVVAALALTIAAGYLDKRAAEKLDAQKVARAETSNSHC